MMAENSGIEWTDHTFNPWVGCTKISPACDHCYAEAWDLRFGGHRWGSGADRRRTKTWGQPVRWNRQAAGVAARRPRVFCASLADVFDNHRSIDDGWRRDLWALIRQTTYLDWLLLTKRPQNVARYLPSDWGTGYPNVWLGTTVENQVEHDRRVPILTAIPAAIRFLSMEPLLGPVDLGGAEGLHWVIAGGESGSQHRPTDPDWFRSLRDQCAVVDVPFLFKQWSGRNQAEIKAKGRLLDGTLHDSYPEAREI
ncbi:Gp37Gp68 family protein [Gluconacetobacter diazotrophicus PA1 5]|nr:Gp37Gp68 family protein [Gluconacetobacter diazotrophicus PA1 5]